MKVKDLIGHLQSTYDMNEPVAVHIWSQTDVDTAITQRMEDTRIKRQWNEMSDLQRTAVAAHILQKMSEHCDSENGMTFTSLETEIEDFSWSNHEQM